MESYRFVIHLLSASLLIFLCQSESSREIANEDFPMKKLPSSAEKELVDAMEELLEKFQNRYPTYEKRAGQIPMCDLGDRCAVKQASRIGKLCDCPRGSSCNSFLLKCI
ncbi:cocaine- and amphetamine-regulated transcript protein-like [Protopterus annectens]|uniref:cocaine- and amphetamine-regulated transcript protein-like n=1 Tax=Protopterus annectens TaxID=7888 RepID=UPI001CFBA1B1|nr:cocaine- and amphetamine-regulated transcript protein-like [Protopterus annectens]